MQVAQLHVVAVDDAKRADPRSGEIQRDGRPQPPRADDENAGAPQAFLAREPDFRQDDLSGVPLELGREHRPEYTGAAAGIDADRF